MIANVRIKIIAALLLLAVFSMAQQKASVVKLKVIHDGLEKPSPELITFIFDKQSVQVAVRDGVFEVPFELVNLEKFTMSAEIGNDRIKVPGLSKMSLIREFWTLYLAEKSYGEEYQYIVHKGIKVSKTCILAFDSLKASGYFIFAEHGRSKRK